MSTDNQSEYPLPTGKSTSRKSVDLLPKYYRTNANKKFLAATLDQLISPGTVKKLNGYIGRQYAKSTAADDIFLAAADSVRQNYQFEPSLVIQDRFNNLKFHKDYIDHINHIAVFGGIVNNHERLNQQEFYSWNPHIDWDKFVNFQQYYWLPYGPDDVEIAGQQPDIVTASITELKLEKSKKSLTIATGLSFTNTSIKIKYNDENYMSGILSSYDTVTGQLIVDIDTVLGDGTYNSWTVISKGVISTYSVQLEDQGDNLAFVISPDGLTRDPTLILYRGLTYVFNINIDNHNFTIKTQRILGNLERYNQGVTNNSISDGQIIFEVPLDAPDILYYVSELDVNIGGILSIQNLDESTIFYVEKDILGKKNYTMSNGYSLSNGMKISFRGKTVPEFYQDGFYYVEGVGTAIKLISEQDLEIIGNFTVEETLAFDQDPFDQVPFSTSSSRPKKQDYIVINRGSVDRNPWTRSNRWFHQDIVIKTAEIKGQVPSLDQLARAIRPIIEFESDIRLYNFGYKNKKNVDLIDTFTKDVFSTIEGSLGYNIDGVELADGMRVLFTADSDRLVKDKIFNVNFVEVTVPSRKINFNAATGINITNDTVTFDTPHSLSTGNRVIYLNNNNTSVNGLIHRKIYYVQVVDEYTVKFYTNQLLSNLVDIFAIGTNIHSVEVFTGLRRQINLTEAEDSEPQLNETVLVKSGQAQSISVLIDNQTVNLVGNQGLMYWYDGQGWKLGPVKYFSNQSPLFDLYDENKISFGNSAVYDGSTFQGNKIFSYKQGTGTADSALDFPLSYRNINNIGDIVFTFDLLNDSFKYKVDRDIFSKTTDVGFLHVYKNTNLIEYKNGWIRNNLINVQPIVRIFKNHNFDGVTTGFPIDCFSRGADLSDLQVKVYVNGKRLPVSSIADIKDEPDYKYVYFKTPVTSNDVITLKLYTKQPKSTNGFYEFPISLQNNPLNNNVKEFTLGQVVDHLSSIVDNLDDRFLGSFPGYNNLRDLGNVSNLGLRFIQHSSPLNFSLYHFGSQYNNLFKAIEKARNDYIQFKNSFITLAGNIGIDTEVKQLTDLVLAELLKDKSKTQPYYLSDMFAYAAYNRLEYVVLDSRVRIYPLTNLFNLDQLSNRAVSIYLNGQQLLHGKDYTFSTDLYFTLSDTLIIADDDILEIYEYESTDGSFCPPTPTKLGIYPLFEPKIYTDNTYKDPVLVIQGHDGSITVAFNDYRDDLILELEKRIFNNIKVNYNKDIFNIHDFIPSYDRKQTYNITEFNKVLSQFFFQWTVNINEDYTKAIEGLYDAGNSFTYNYRNNFYPDGTPNPAYWRGIYQYSLDTDRPHTHPWECLGFTIEPRWWRDIYGEAPYTSDNFILWDDIRQGIIREPGKVVKYLPQYAKSILTNRSIVDNQGNLLSPSSSNQALGNLESNDTGYYQFGDHGPVETAWRRSSSYAFALIQTILLLSPSRILGTCFDRSRIIRNLDNQLVYKNTNLRIRLQDIELPSTSLSSKRVQAAGLVNYIIDYITSDTTNFYDQYQLDLSLLTNKISSKLGGFTSKSKFKILLDSKNPVSTSGIFVPEENYNLYLNTSSPLRQLVYSGVVITKYPDGFEIRGYNRDAPYFNYYISNFTGKFVTIGGISENFVTWADSQLYSVGSIVKYNNAYYRTTIAHTSTFDFNELYFVGLAKLPVIGGVTIELKTRFVKSELLQLTYGTRLPNTQTVVDFLLGYAEYLKDEGFIFEEFNPNLKSIDNWESSAKEFVFWTTQNWSPGSAISLSPCAKLLSFKKNQTVIENITDNFYGYKIFRVDGEKLDRNFTNTFREDNEFGLEVNGTNHGIYGAIFHLVQKEHILLLDNKTLFNDVIYDLEPGYRQEKVKIVGYISTNWNGGFQIPGFIFDTADIQEWSPWVDYRLGDVVFNKEFYYTASKTILGSEKFNSDDWVLLSEKPVSRLLPNWDYRAEQFTDFYDLDSDNFDTEQQKLAQHLIGYQKRQYLENIIQDEVSQYKFYQGMIIEKGTENVLSKLFDVLSSDNQESLSFNEEWAVRVGTYGGTSLYEEVEFKLDESEFKLVPQPFEIVETIDQTEYNAVIKQRLADVYIKPSVASEDLFPISNVNNFLRTPGYVRFDEVKYVVDTLDAVLGLNINDFQVGDYVWCAFQNRDWNIYRLTPVSFNIIDVEYDEVVQVFYLQCDRIPTIANNIIGIANTTQIDGFYSIIAINNNKILINSGTTDFVDFNDSSSILVYQLTSVRTNHVDDANDVIPTLLKTNELLYADNDGYSRKTVYQHSKVYSQRTFNKYDLPIAQSNFGKSITLSKNGLTCAVADRYQVTIFTRSSTGSAWIQQDVIANPITSTFLSAGIAAGDTFIPADNTVFFPNSGLLIIDDEQIIYTSKTNFGFQGIIRGINGTTPSSHSYKSKIFEYYSYLSGFGNQMEFSPDSEWLAISAPNASNLQTGFKGLYDGGSGANPYVEGDIVKLVHKVGTKHIYLNTHWKAKRNIIFGGDWSTIDNFSQDWEPADLIEIDSSKPANNYSNQGYVNLYQRSNQAGSYILRHSFVSPNPCPPGLSLLEAGNRPEYQEQFGSKLSMAQNGDEYVLAVSSAGYNNNQGRVYLFRYGVTRDDSTVAWRMDYTKDYKGNFNSSLQYTVGDLVVYQDELYECVSEPEFQGPVPSLSSAWSITSRSNILGYFPQEAVDVTLDNHLVVPPLNDENIEMVISGDLFGFDVDLNLDGTKMIISAPAADQVLFENYKGPFRPALKYRLDDVVFFQGAYYQYNRPESMYPIGGLDLDHWDLLTDKRLLNSGKVFVYNFDSTKGYVLDQTLVSTNIDDSTQDRFGESISITESGNRIAVSSTLSDIKKIDSGRVLVFKESNDSYQLQQKIYSNIPEAFELFGSRLHFMNNDETLVIFSAKGDVKRITTFDTDQISLDQNRTRFIDLQIDSGRVDVYDRLYENYIFAESLDTSQDNEQTDRYGCSLAVSNNNICVGAMYEDGSSVNAVYRAGKVYSYSKVPNTRSWAVKHKEDPRANPYKIKKAYFYNNFENTLIAYIDVIDPVQGKIPGPADQEIRYKTYYDPAVYTNSGSAANPVRDVAQFWDKAYVGQLWWDLSRAKFIEYQVGTTSFQNTNFNKLFPTGSIDIYEWVESKYLPSEWDNLVNTDRGIAEGISGISKNGDNSYVVKQKFDNVSKTFISFYYFWVKNPTVVPNVEGRILSAQDVSNLIADPLAEGYSCLGITSSNSISFINCERFISGKNTNLNVEFWTSDDYYTDINSHSQWKIISEHPNTVIPKYIEEKWIDSLIGKDSKERVVPDLRLPYKKKYGVNNRPRQSMFINRVEALKQFIERVNSVISTRLITDDYDLSNLSLAENIPSAVSGVYDITKDITEELQYIGTALIRQAILTPQITDGRITGVNIIDTGYGYVNAPFIIVKGIGKNALIKSKLNNVGSVIGADIIDQGYGYRSDTNFIIRPYAALVYNDTNAFNTWSVYNYNANSKTWDKVRSQSFDVTKFWSYQDWYKEGYNQFTKIDYVIGTTYNLARINPSIGQIVKVNSVGTGGWLLLKRYNSVISLDYTQNYEVIGRQNGTIKFSNLLYDFNITTIGFDSGLFDSIVYDNMPVKELRIIIDTIKNKLFIDDLYVEYLKLFLSSLRYVLDEQIFVDWIMKSSFVKVTHKAGDLKQKVTYRNDSLENYEDYVKEVKPYRTKIREYISSYQKLDKASSSVTDFDLPPIIDSQFNIQNITTSISSNGLILSNYEDVNQYPWKHWYDNLGFYIQSIEILDQGSGYINPPVVKIIGGFGKGAQAKAYLNQGKINRIQVVSAGSGFLKAPIIELDGGLGINGVQAKAVAIIESQGVRSNKIAIKFDRIARDYYVSDLVVTETFTGTGSRQQWAIKFAPLTKINTHSVLIDNIDVLKENYSLRLVKSQSKGFTSYSGLLVLETAPGIGSVVEVMYTKSFNHLSATDRINFYYNPNQGETGKDLAQLMTGIDYGGVNITGVGFNITGGWDSQPYFTDGFDAFDPDFDDYIVTVSDSTYQFTLPWTPADGEVINVYVNGSRIDDPYYNVYDGSTTQPNGRKVAPAGRIMNSIIGDGSTNSIILPTLESIPPLDIQDGDTIIFRRSTSDGSYTPLEGEYDTELKGGTLAYNTATGLSPDDINVDGDNFVTPISSNAPEEIVPGQIVDSVAIKVYQLPSSGASKIMFKNHICDGSTTEFYLGQIPQNEYAIIVKLDNIILEKDVDYTFDWTTRAVTLTVAPANKKILNTISFSYAGAQILDTNYFISDGSTVEYITSAPWRDEDLGHIVLVNGLSTIYEIFKTDQTYVKAGQVGIRFGQAPEINSVILYFISADNNSTASIMKLEELPADGSTLSFTLTNTAGIKEPIEDNVLVLVDGGILNPSNTEYIRMKDNELTYNLKKYKSVPFEPNPVDIDVYKDGVLLTYGTEYSFDLSVVSITINPSIYTESSVLIIYNNKDADYNITNNTIIFSVAPPDNSRVEVITFYNHNILEIVRTKESIAASGALQPDTPDYFRFRSLQGGKIELFRQIKSDDYVWIIKNNQLLSHSVDYYLSWDHKTVVLKDILTEYDVLDIIVYGSSTINNGYGYMQFKDMLNRVHYKRLNKNKSTRLGQDLTQQSSTIVVVDGSKLSSPNASQNLPGIIEINGERIEYYTKNGNILGQIRRGTLGTGVPIVHTKDTLVQDIGITETIPYNDTQFVENFISDGSSKICNLTNFIASSKDEINVFVGGYRMKKNPYTRFLESNGYPYSPEGDSNFDKEFDLINDETLELLNLPQENTKIAVVKTVGRVWTDINKNLDESSGAVARFITSVETNYPEYPLE